ncbi:DsbE family thiol:disulfide interchange protein [Marinobacter qingdaonensis]|uniref:DsbE family thiol:disulfide interchange protein n=1 Tax=Marinobacter qingdaonensis TaxID=3108486 RepID=A0ABU5P0H8_9GAMM|nr:DsbE family thiol:disulfide interchange protein [Marinobacter sp. ASW11-75]MEA1081561.1 DsbE family thiol:disulfide interchange protein [Marinobacter sp. ASW11-75]MEE3117288.1 DsbE family thiol:disulfide interchange protein [Pseudomonadota bacterium]
MKRFFLFLPLVVAVVLGMVLFAGIGKDPTKLDSALVGQPVPAFSLEDLDNPGQQLDASLFQGQVQLLNVWGTWCPACRDEHDDLMWLAREQGVSIVGLNYKDNRDDALVWLDRLGDPYSTNIYDPQGRLGFDLGVYGAPETFVIDAQGVVRYRHVGVVNKKVWQDTLLPVINQVREQG